MSLPTCRPPLVEFAVRRCDSAAARTVRSSFSPTPEIRCRSCVARRGMGELTVALGCVVLG